MSQSYTYVDPAGNQAQYTIYDADRRKEHLWTTEHGDQGKDASFAAAQDHARTALKTSMALRRRSGLAPR